MPARTSRLLIIAEVIICFAFPVFALFLGLITLPLMLGGVSLGANFALIHVAEVGGGCLGMLALAQVLRFYMTEKPEHEPHWPPTLAFAGVGVVSLWTEMTGQFHGFEFNWGSALSAIAPTLSTLHIMALGLLTTRKRHASVAA